MLTDKQARFVEEYLIDTNAAEAARRAGYKGKHASTELMKDKEVTNTITARIRQRSKKMELKAEEVLGELANIAFVNLSDFVNSDGSYKDIHEMSREAASCIMSVQYHWDKKTGKRSVVGYIFWDKSWAIELCMRHLGMLNDKLELKHDTTDNFLAMVLERAKQPRHSNVIDAKVVQEKLGAIKNGPNNNQQSVTSGS